MSEPDVPNADSHLPEDDGNFLHVVIFAVIALVLGLIVAVILVRYTGIHLMPGGHAPYSTSEVVLRLSRAIST